MICWEFLHTQYKNSTAMYSFCTLFLLISLWTASWQNQQNGMCPSENSDQPGHPPSLIRSSLSAWRKLRSLATHWMCNEDSDQTGRMPRLIWVFTGHTVILLVLSWGGSYSVRTYYVQDLRPRFIPVCPLNHETNSMSHPELANFYS